MTSWQIYWITRLDSLTCVSTLLFCICIVGCFILIPVWVEEWEHRVRFTKIIVSITSVVLLIGLFIPSTKEMAFILFAPKIANSKFIQEIPEDMLELKKLSMDYIHETLLKDKK